MTDMRALSDPELLRELEPTVAANLDRHLAVAEEWMPHEWVPWSRGQDFAGKDGVPWNADQANFPEAVRAAFELNLLTEDNLPSYHHELAVRFGLDGSAWSQWIRRWTAEEARHATSIRDYLVVTRAVDPAALEHDRMATMQAGWTSEGKGVLQSLVYVTVQEFATRIAHRNTGRAAKDPAAEKLLLRVAADENLHMVFYRDLITAALALVPEQTIAALAAELIGFRMPGATVPGFMRKSVQIAEAGIYDIRLHRDQVVVPLLRHWRALELHVKSTAAQRAQSDLATHLDRLEQMSRRFEERRAAHRDAGAA